MNVLIVTQYFYPENFRINDLAVSISENGHTVTVLTGYPNYPSGKIFPGYGFFKKHVDYYNNIKIIRVPLIPRGKKSSAKLFLNYISFMLSASLKVLFLLKKKIDIIFVYEPSPITVAVPAIILKKLTNTPLFLWVLDLWPDSLIATNSIKTGWILRIVGIMVRWIYRQTDKILISSGSFQKHLVQMDVQKKNIIYFPNWADKEFEEKSSSPGNTLAVPEGFIVLFAGNVGYAQDVETLFEAADSLKAYTDIHFVILGEGRKYGWLHKEIFSRELRVTFHLLGQKTVGEVKEYYSRSDVLYLSLKNDKLFEDTVPGKLQSYLISGKPIIGAIRGEAAQIIKDSKAGIVCEPGNIEMIKNAVLKIYMMSKEERNIIGINGCNYYWANFSRKHVTSGLLNHMQEAIRS